MVSVHIIYLLSLIVKLADHGCFRLLQQLQSYHYPEKWAEAIAYFSSCELASALLHYTTQLTAEEEVLCVQLMAEKRQVFTQQWLRLNTFTNHIENAVRQYLIENHNSIDAACN
ncbi:MAG: hypothetical protein ACSLEN_03170 [Candidatus Malihini olakiniferum]